MNKLPDSKHHDSGAKLPVVLLHAGAGAPRGDQSLLTDRRAALERVMTAVWPKTAQGLSAVAAVALALELLELEPCCNAGLGGYVQRDGMARLTASIMDGSKQKFSGVMLATHTIHPSKLALALQDRPESVLGPLGAQLLARELGMPPENPVHAAVAQKWAKYIEDSSQSQDRSGTVGAVVIDTDGRLAAGTSTGGTYMNSPERISDSATVAGNYASRFAAISCTGTGEQIVDDAIAARIETRVRDGMPLVAACNRVFDEATALKRSYGWIAVDSQGAWAAMTTTSAMPFAMMSASRETPLFG